MDDAQRRTVCARQRVRELEATANLAPHLGYERGRQLLVGFVHAAPEQPGHVDAVDRLHHQVVGAVLLRELEHLHDVGMDETRRDVRLVDEHAHELRLPGETGVDALEDERARKGGRPLAHRAVDLGHPAASDLLRQPVFHGTMTMATPPDVLDSANRTRCKVVAATPVAMR